MRHCFRPTVLLLSFATLCSIGACAAGVPTTPPPPVPPPLDTPAPSAAAPSSVDPQSATSATPPPPLAPIRFVPAIASDPPNPMPSVAISAPKSGEALAVDKASDFQIKLDVKDWATQHGGNHVHLILDNNPYKPIYDTASPVRMADLNNGAALTEGEHVLVAFPSRPNHESVKPDKGKVPLAVLPFFVGKKGKGAFNAKTPLFIYSRPKGAYNGPLHSERVLIDFYLHGLTLGDGQSSIRVSVDGPDASGLKDLTMKTWKPFLLENLRNGEYTLTLEVLDKAGHPVAGAWNKTARKITVNRDAADDPKAGAPAPMPDSASK